MTKKHFGLGARVVTVLICLAVALGIVASISFVGRASASESVIPADGKYYADYDTFAEAQAAAADLNVEITGEGSVLLKNKDNALPMKNERPFVSIFGMNQKSMPSAESGYRLADALEDEGFHVNKSLRNYYESDAIEVPSGRNSTDLFGLEPDPSTFPQGVQQSNAMYNDAAFVFVTRGGGEGADLSRITKDEQGADDWHYAPYAEDENGDYVDVTATDTDPEGTTRYKHHLQLTDEEEKVLDYVKGQGFKKIIYIINSSYPMELDQLEQDEAVDGIIWIGRPGDNGTKAVAKIISGEINPSGGLADIYYKDFTADPTWFNFGNNIQNGTTNNYMDHTGTHTNPDWNTAAGGFGGADGYFGIDYDEDIYLGYKYYETRAYEMNKAKGDNSGSTWYDDAVVYPFGYGLSYTTFSYGKLSLTLDSATTDSKKPITEDATLNAADIESYVTDGSKHTAAYKTMTATIDVTNTGNVAGKETVQIYATAPYDNAAPVEKSYVKLVGYQKTDLLQPGETQTVTVTFNVQDMASYDYLGNASGGEEKGYVVEAGDWTLRAMSQSDGWQGADVASSNDLYDEVNFTVDEDAYLHLDDFNDNEVSNKFSEENGMFYSLRKSRTGDDAMYNFNKTTDADQQLISRGNIATVGVNTLKPTTASMTMSENMLKSLLYWDNFAAGTEVQNYAYTDDAYTPTGAMTDASGKAYVYADGLEIPGVVARKDYPWLDEALAAKAAGVMDDWTQVASHATTTDPVTGLYTDMETSLADMSGNDPFDGGKGQDAWTNFLNQLTWEDLMATVGQWQKKAVPGIGLKVLSSGDGIAFGNTYKWPCTTMLASTWNPELSYKQGRMMGNLGLLKNINVFWGSSVQTHRSPFGGRLYEYTSEDAILGGYISAGQVKGLVSKGIQPYIKHVALNDQETNRNGRNLMAWVSEQAIRENYYKVVQMCVQEGESTGEMGAFARAGRVSVNVNYNITTGLYKEEWGAKTLSHTTDAYAGMRRCSPLDLLVRAGTDTIATNTMTGVWDAENNKVDYTTISDATLESNTELVQWYATRKCTAVFMWGHANTALNDNGVNYEAWSPAAISLAQGVAAPATTTVGSTAMADDNIVYSVSSGTLPAGLSMDAETGAISGTPTVPGSSTVTVMITADGWMTQTRNVTINVAPSIAVSTTAGTTGTAFSATVTSDLEWIAFSATGLPEGLSINDLGQISGTPEEAGEYDAVISALVEEGNKEVTYDLAVTFTIAKGTLSAPEFDVVNGMIKFKPEGSNTWVDVIAVSELRGENGADGADGADGTNGADGKEIELRTSDTHIQWRYEGDTEWTDLVALSDITGPKGDKGDKGDAGEAAQGGCGSNVAGTVAVVAACLALGAAVLLILKKKA